MTNESFNILSHFVILKAGKNKLCPKYPFIFICFFLIYIYLFYWTSPACKRSQGRISSFKDSMKFKLNQSTCLRGNGHQKIIKCRNFRTKCSGGVLTWCVASNSSPILIIVLHRFILAQRDAELMDTCAHNIIDVTCLKILFNLIDVWYYSEWIASIFQWVNMMWFLVTEDRSQDSFPYQRNISTLRHNEKVLSSSVQVLQKAKIHCTLYIHPYMIMVIEKG